MLVGRSREQEALRNVVLSLGQGLSAALVLRGEAGIGKTALLDDVVEMAADVDVVRLAGLESEAHLEFAAMHRLLIPHLSGVDALPPTQAQALRTAIGLAADVPANSFLLGLSVLTLLANSTPTKPLLIVIDDAQWLDAESVEILGFVARRLFAESIGMIFSVREPADQQLLEGIPTIHVGGLSRSDASDLLLTLAPEHVDRQVSDRVAIRSRGNPLVIIEVSRELETIETSRSLLLDDPLPMGERLEKHFGEQVSTLPGDCQRTLLYAAAHPDLDIRLLWTATARDGISSDAAHPAVSSGLAKIAATLQFRHPMIRSAVYANASTSDRRHVHEVLATLMDPSTETDLRAWHLAAAANGPDEDAAAALEEGARTARSRGGYLSEATYLARAADLSPDPKRRASRLLNAAQAALTGGAPLRAQALLDAGLSQGQDPFLQAQIKKVQANALHRAGKPGRDTPAILMSSATVFAAIDIDMARETMLEALEQTFIRGALITGTTPLEVGRAALLMVSEKADVTDVLLAATGTYLCSGYLEAVPLIRRAIVALGAADALGEQVPRWFALGQLLAQLVWDEKAAHSWLIRCEALARRTGAIEYLTMTLTPLSGVEAVLGELASAESRIADLRQLSRAIGIDEDRVNKIENARLLAWLGLDDRAREAATRSFEVGAAIGAGNNQRLAQLALVVVELGRARYNEAYSVCKKLIEYDQLALTNEALPNLVEAAVRSNHFDEALLAVENLAVRARASGTPWALGLLARSEAIVATDADAEMLFDRAISHLGQTAVRTDLARSHLLYGEWLRRQKRRSDARTQLRIAHDMFDDMGARAFAQRTQTELLATGERHHTAAHDLTPQEAQIARLAADGATNNEIATQLFISSHTVEYHLRKVYRKLDVASRRSLRAVMRGSAARMGDNRLS
ncbi:LuxR C-terminal-related transcriptional regulator [Jatrophihabitans telluris]|uniref:LuxR C-terminal-related transcriptional regulator n=1 Tax=Jatrophihabitans telluris TaxID=2038343 RepID=A0ABY4QUY1_9ACTN|nr:helix-turn-helix transcriptional regulator [Jatrophihabitans telluris]UQX87104.1 LuxR C-terminal-related transcriptional regulator [Jatrophihabitans telluris]